MLTKLWFLHPQLFRFVMVHVIEALIYYCIDLKKLWLDRFDKVVGLAVLVAVHPSNLGLIKEGFGMMS